jgi:DNA-binding transcriptional regulator YdaS (Cro superfamily)
MKTYTKAEVLEALRQYVEILGAQWKAAGKLGVHYTVLNKVLKGTRSVDTIAEALGFTRCQTTYYRSKK